MAKDHRKYMFLINQNFNIARYNQIRVIFRDIFADLSLIQEFPEIQYILSDI